MGSKGDERSFLRVRVAVDVEKSLVSGFWVPRGNKMVWVEVKYERIADFCFECGRLEHVKKNCEKGNRLAEGMEGKRRYGLWMKAAPARAMREAN